MMQLQSGHEVVPLEGEEKKKQSEDWGGYKEGLVRLNPGRWLFPYNYKIFADKIYNFQFRNTDVVVMTYPKCGTTWTQEIIWTMRNNPDLNHPKAHLHVLLRSPFMDFDMFDWISKPESLQPQNPFHEAFMQMCPGKNPADGVHLQLAEAIPDPRTIKSHLPFSLMPPTTLDIAKVVYVARNPKDVIISYHHHCKIIKVQDFLGSFDNFVDYFVDDDLAYSPYWLHMKEAWEKRDHPNLHIMFFEDMKANPLEELRKLNTFLNTNLDEKQLENIVKYTSFNEMKARNTLHVPDKEEVATLKDDSNKEEKSLFRKGESGDWKGKLTPAQEAKVDQWIENNMSSFGIKFKYEL